MSASTRDPADAAWSVDVVVNGEPMSLPVGATVADVVARLAPDAVGGARGTAVALGDEVVPSGSWAATPVVAGDRLEVLRAVAGG
ncbi:sulfur carrier protein ThiS [Quadrisphaera sp. DSM 44207]|uniref:sulfur carrier protein ThiS n=1 Tax=Quadrisphaera sp. DSM 44207 TaxID=1881057 RepID=UPI00089151EA|nr:sulfur carrier protein ThiS [Quadrisphaera sp. DSM 44207]SDQ78730.1 sulfur carrier protein [Quadrisphaera sp. DSM 44207]